MIFHMCQTHGEIVPVWLSPLSKQVFRGLPNGCAEVNIRLENKVPMLLLHLKDCSVGEPVTVE